MVPRLPTLETRRVVNPIDALPIESSVLQSRETRGRAMPCPSLGPQPREGPKHGRVRLGAGPRFARAAGHAGLRRAIWPARGPRRSRVPRKAGLSRVASRDPHPDFAGLWTRPPTAGAVFPAFTKTRYSTRTAATPDESMPARASLLAVAVGQSWRVGDVLGDVAPCLSVVLAFRPGVEERGEVFGRRECALAHQ